MAQSIEWDWISRHTDDIQEARDILNTVVARATPWQASPATT